MSSCQATYEVNLTRKRFIISLSDIRARAKDGGVVILPLDGGRQHKIWCLTKHLHGGFQKKKKELPDSKELKIKWRRIVKICLNQEEYEDSHDPKNDDIEHDEVQNP